MNIFKLIFEGLVFLALFLSFYAWTIIGAAILGVL